MNPADKKTLLDYLKAIAIGALVVGLLWIFWTAVGHAQTQTKVTYTGWNYAAQTETLTLTFTFPSAAVKTLQIAGGLADAKAIADKMGKQAAQGFNNVISEASESKKGKLAQWFDAKATAAQKAAFEAWADTVGTYERNNPVVIESP